MDVGGRARRPNSQTFMPQAPGYKAVFLDRDGTLIIDTGYCSDPSEVKLIDGVQESLRRLKQAGFKLVIVTNQSGIGRGYFGEREFWAVQKELERRAGGGLIDATYFCPDTPENAGERRKPNPGMLLEGIDLPESYMIGDKVTDIEAGIRAGVKAAILVSSAALESLSASGATFVVRDLLEAAEIILEKA
jgi:D-glycero-D-manno-heptose 1,7-bisphosphate phosphatase